MRVRVTSLVGSILIVLLALAGGAAPAWAATRHVSADLNGDGVRDRVDVGPSRHVVITLSGGGRAQHLAASHNLVGVALADVDHDGDADLLVSSRTSPLRVFLNGGGGQFAPHTPRRGPPAHGLAARSIETPSSTAVHVDAGETDDALLPDVEHRPQPVLAHRARIAHADAPTLTRSAGASAPRGPPARS